MKKMDSHELKKKVKIDFMDLPISKNTINGKIIIKNIQYCIHYFYKKKNNIKLKSKYLKNFK